MSDYNTSLPNHSTATPNPPVIQMAQKYLCLTDKLEFWKNGSQNLHLLKSPTTLPQEERVKLEQEKPNTGLTVYQDMHRNACCNQVRCPAALCRPKVSH